MMSFITTKAIAFCFSFTAFCYWDYKQKRFHFGHASELSLKMKWKSRLSYPLVTSPLRWSPGWVFTGCGNLFIRFLHLTLWPASRAARPAQIQSLSQKKRCASQVRPSPKVFVKKRKPQLPCLHWSQCLPGPRFKSWLPHIVAVGSWANHLDSLNFLCLFSKKGIIIGLPWRQNSRVCIKHSAKWH